MTKRLKFREKYKEGILSGRKRTTLRRETKLKPGDKVVIEAGEERIGEAVIEDVSEIRVEELTEEHAREDGFSSLEELLRELKSIYGSEVLRSGTRLKLIKFDMRSQEESEE